LLISKKKLKKAENNEQNREKIELITEKIEKTLFVEDLINSSPDKESSLSNWGENPNQAYRDALRVYLNNDNPVDAYQLIWNDFYGSYSKEYLQVLSKYFDGQLLKLQSLTAGDVYHFVAYTPTIITVLDKTYVKKIS